MAPAAQAEPTVIDRHGYLRWRPVEVDTPLRKLHWFWHPNDEASLKSDFPKIIETLRTYQPNTMVFADTALFEYGDIRWAGTESGSIDYENWKAVAVVVVLCDQNDVTRAGGLDGGHPLFRIGLLRIEDFWAGGAVSPFAVEKGVGAEV